MSRTSMPRYRLAIFDFDGTLADSFPFFVSVFNRLAERHGFRAIAPDEIESLRRLGPREVMQRVGMPAWKLPLVTRSFLAMMREGRAGIARFEGIDALLPDLAREGVALAIVSSNARDNVAAVLGEANMSLIRHAECGASVFGKAARLTRILRRTGHAPSDAIYIGDQPTDIEAARRAGMASGAVAWGYGEIGSLRAHGPDEEFATVAQIARIAGSADVAGRIERADCGAGCAGPCAQQADTHGERSGLVD